ncbi:MAG: carboxypeptidase regulatory-like domain-containing protein [Candidatus Marinimicrobia bacterium]|nr:carboxypeptidase regulatory-like domain-containing protein [Candidatus Neomarinimicrobiota bacterium]
MMRTINPRGLSWLLIVSIMIMAMPMFMLADDTGSTPDIERLKQIRQMQSQQDLVENLKENSLEANATPEQERMLRLSKALASVTGEKAPTLTRSHSLGRSRSEIQLPQTTQSSGLREVIYGNGVMAAAGDTLLYFNFLTGENSSDSLGMDVRITNNEGTNFGNEYANYSDPSWLFWLADSGSLDEVTSVPAHGDPDFMWTASSWSWLGGNNGQPLGLHNIWVVYARTSHMYVALEVTYVEPWNTYFEFDYLIQTDGSNIFDDTPSTLDLTVNGLEADTMEVGSTPYFEASLDDDPIGALVIFYDANHDGFWDDGDVALEDYEFMDNDMHDEDPTDGIFGFTYDDEMADGLNYLASDLIFVVYSGMASAEVSVTFYSLPTPYSVSGFVYDGTDGLAPLEDIVVWASMEWDDEGPSIIGVTDSAGYYHLDIPDSGWVFVGSEDHFGATDGLIPAQEMYDIEVYGHIQFVDFIYEEPSSIIQGYVLDEMNQPLVDVEVMAKGPGPGFSAWTNEYGFYSIGVMPGWYDVEVDWWSLPGPYMLPFRDEIEVGEDEIVDFDIYLHTTNSTISGGLFLDAVPVMDGAVFAWNHDIGYSITLSDEDGLYVLPVLDMGGTLYDLDAKFNDAENVVQVSDNWDVPAGATEEDIHLMTLFGGLHGYFINGETGAPINDPWEVGMGVRSIDNGNEYHTGPDQDGYYEIWVPDGLYEVMAGGMAWNGDGIDTILVDGMLVPYDVILWPIAFDTFVEGHVFDQFGNPLENAHVSIGNEHWGGGTNTDDMGFYHFDVPHGYYTISAHAEGYYDVWQDVDLNGGPIFHDFYLEAFQVDGVIAGLVFDFDTGLPLADANVYINNDQMGWHWYTDDSGEFMFDLPNGDYSLYVEHPDFIDFWLYGIMVEDDTVFIDVPLMVPDGGLDGFVYDSDQGYPIQNAEVALFRLADSTWFWGYTDDSGYFEIPAMNGDYDVWASAHDHQPSEMQTITISDNWISMDFYLEYHQFAMPPMFNFIVDQPFDQGRQVRMSFWPGGTDWGPFTGYSIWRTTNTPMGETFDFVDYIPNHDFGEYMLVAPTLVDSSAYISDPFDFMSLFMVTGHWDAYGYMDGPPMGGYSIDNIHPGIPGPLALLSASEDGVEIGWEMSMADDFQYFEVYRATNPDFTDADVYATVEPMFSDGDVIIGQTYYYTVSAVDANGNMSETTNVVTTSIVSVDDLEMIPTAYGLSQNYPNPFNPTTSIEFALPEASEVSLEIYNLLGQKVRTLVTGYVPAGYINTSWDGLNQNGKEISSGTYIYRLQTADQTFSKKMVLMK